MDGRLIMTRAKTFGVGALVLWITMALVSPGLAQTQINSIAVEGNQRIPDSTVVSLTGIERGAVLTDGQISGVLQDVLASGLFETATIDTRGSELVITVVERPTINRINIEGNRRLDDETLLGFISSEPRRVFSPTQAQRDAEAIVSVYADASRLAATVTPKIIRRSDNRVDLIFEVTEGKVVENERISFVGNREYSDRRLRRVIQTKEAGLLRAVIGSDTFIADRIAFDRQLLTDFYQSRGFVDFQVLDVTTELSRERDATFITFILREGQRFEVGQVSVTSEFPDANLEEFRDAIRLRPGETWNPAAIDEQIERLERLALQQGFDFLRADPRVTRNARDLTLDIEFALVRGPRIFVERIDIEGNQTTLDRVIRRQFDTVEGDPFNPREIRNAAERIRALGFFASSSVETRQGSAPDQVIVDVDVEEQPTGSLSLGGSYSTEAGIGLNIGFSERNFLGRGQFVSFDILTADEDQRISLQFSEPAFLGRDLTLGLRTRYITTDFDDAAYETEVLSFSPSLAFPVSENGRLRVYYEVADEKIKNVNPLASPIIAADAGSDIKSALGYSYTLDLLRGGLNPNRGARFTFGQELAGLGGDVKYLETTVRTVAERAVFNEEITLRAIFEGGVITSFDDEDVRITDRFFLNTSQLRGFSSRGVGPRDTNAGFSDVLGGNKYFSARFEADFPFGLPEEYGISGGVFVDFASVWDLDNTTGAGLQEVDDSFELRSSVGVSIFWTSPIGPLRLNFAKAIKENPLDETETFDLVISTQF